MTSHTLEMQAVLDRLENLERQNRRLKRAGTLALFVLAALALMGQAAPKTKTLETQQLVLRDSNGKLRAAFGAYQDGPRLVLTGDDERPRIDVTVKEGSPMLQTLDAGGTVTWSAPGNPVPQITAASDRQHHVFIERLFYQGPVTKGSENTAAMALFGQVCRGPVLTIDQQKADYTLHLETLLQGYPNMYRDYRYVSSRNSDPLNSRNSEPSGKSRKG
jgi:hypothetical protein